MKLVGDEREFLGAEASALAAALEDPDARKTYRRLAEAAEAGEVPDELEAAAGLVASVAVESGRARQVHGPAGVRALVAVWKRAPQGEEATTEAGELNQALTSLRGLPVRAVTVTPTGPGAFSISISAGEYEVRLGADPGGIRLKSLNVGGGGIGE